MTLATLGRRHSDSTMPPGALQRRRTTRWRILSCGGAMLLALAATTISATAGAIPVIDVGSIAQLAVQAGEVWAQLQAVQQQVATLRAAAQQLDPRSYQSVRNLLAGNDVNYASLIHDVQSMGYSLERVNSRFRQLFPDDEAVKKMTPAQAEAVSRDMNREIHSSALVAARSQTTLRAIEANNTEARNILSRSESNGSQVAQLQSAIQMLGLIHQNIVAINQMISAAGRVTSNVVARGATERRIARERDTRMRSDYVEAAPVPAVDSRLLAPW